MRKRVALAAAGGAVVVLSVVAQGALAAFPGTDGKIAYGYAPGGGLSQDIFAMNANGTNPVQLTSTADTDDWPDYSADGERIAFGRDPVGTVDGQIWVMNQNGTGQTQLTPGAPSDDYSPAFSPDGRIVFERLTGSDNQLWIINGDGTGATQLTFPGASGDQAYDPVVSPNGAKIAFAYFQPATTTAGIAQINIDGSGFQALTAPPVGTTDYQPDYSPSGNTVIFARGTGVGTGITAINTDGTGLRSILAATPEGYFGPAYSPQGTQFAFETQFPPPGGSNLAIGNPAGTDLPFTPVTANATGAFSVSADWQPLNPPACELGGNRKQKRYGKVRLTATCANENALLIAEGKGKAPRPPKRAAARKAKKFKIPAVSALVAAGAPTSVTLSIPKKGRKALKKAAKAGKKGKATINATLTDDLGQSSKDTFKVTFKAKKKKKR